MSKRQKITDFVDPVLTMTDSQGEPLHHHVYLASDNTPSQVEYDTSIRDTIVDLVSPSWNQEISEESLPTLTKYRSETVHKCIQKLRLHFSNVVSRITIEAGGTGFHQRGHHPLFSYSMLHRTDELEPSKFTKVPSFDFLKLDDGLFNLALSAEMTLNNNRRLENFFFFNVDENSKVYEMLPDEASSTQITRNRYVLSKGLTFHELIILYYSCSKRRMVVEENWNALENVFCYIYPQDLRNLISEMDDFIETHGKAFHRNLNENQFFDSYMKSFYHMMLDPVEEGNFDLFHVVLNDDE